MPYHLNKGTHNICLNEGSNLSLVNRSPGGKKWVREEKKREAITLSFSLVPTCLISWASDYFMLDLSHETAQKHQKNWCTLKSVFMLSETSINISTVLTELLVSFFTAFIRLYQCSACACRLANVFKKCCSSHYSLYPHKGQITLERQEF